jgi:hypothetical protein
MTAPIIRLHPSAPLIWQRHDDTRVLGPHTVVAVFAGSLAAVPPRPPHIAPALVLRIEYTRLFEDARCEPTPPEGLKRQNAVGRYRMLDTDFEERLGAAQACKGPMAHGR